MTSSTTRTIACLLMLSSAAVCAAGDDNAHAAHVGTARAVSGMVQYAVPRVTLVRNDGARVSLPEEMNDGRPVLLNFIFTSCGSTCPLMSQVFGEFQRKLGKDAPGVHLMS